MTYKPWIVKVWSGIAILLRAKSMFGFLTLISKPILLDAICKHFQPHTLFLRSFFTFVLTGFINSFWLLFKIKNTERPMIWTHDQSFNVWWFPSLLREKDKFEKKPQLLLGHMILSLSLPPLKPQTPWMQNNAYIKIWTQLAHSFSFGWE